MLVIDGIGAAAIATVAFVLGGLVKGLVGFGLPLITIPILSSIASIPEAIALNFLPVVFSNVLQINQTRHARAVLWRVWPLIVTTVVLLYFGSVFLTALDKGAVQFFIGVLIVGHVLAERGGWVVTIRRPFERASLFAAGLLAAILASLSSFSMFPSVQVLHGMRLERDEFVLSVCAFLLAVYVTLWFGLSRHGVSVTALLPDSLACTVPLALGTLLGGVLRKRVSQAVFRRWVAAGLLATGAALIVRQAIAWLGAG